MNNRETLRCIAGALVLIASATGLANESGRLKDIGAYVAGKTRTEVKREMATLTIEDQYAIYLYGVENFHPPILDWAVPLAERGPQAWAFLEPKIASAKDGRLIDDLYLVDLMAAMGTYRACESATVSDRLKYLVANNVSDPSWRAVGESMLSRIARRCLQVLNEASQNKK
jgi:hypothetical protein